MGSMTTHECVFDYVFEINLLINTRQNGGDDEGCMGVGSPQVHGQANMVLDHGLQLPGAPGHLLEVVGAHVEEDGSWVLAGGSLGNLLLQN